MVYGRTTSSSGAPWQGVSVLAGHRLAGVGCGGSGSVVSSLNLLEMGDQDSGGH
jgi:hypothetical protein